MSKYTQKNKPTGKSSASPLQWHSCFHHADLSSISTNFLTLEEFGIHHALNCFAWCSRGYIKDEETIKKFLIHNFKISNNTKVYKRVLELFWVQEESGWTTELIKETIRNTKVFADENKVDPQVEGVVEGKLTPKLTPKLNPSRPPSSTQVGFSNSLILLDHDETSKKVSKLQVSNLLLNENQIQKQPHHPESGFLPDPSDGSFTEEDMKKIVALNLQTGKAVYADIGENNGQEQISQITINPRPMEDILKEIDNISEEELARCNALEAKMAAEVAARQEAENKRKHQEFIELSGKECKLAAILTEDGYDDQEVEKFFGDCSYYAKKATGGLKEVYEHFLEGSLLPKSSWIRNDAREAVKVPSAEWAKLRYSSGESQ